MYILDRFREIKKTLSIHKPLIEVFIFKNNLLHNLKQFKHSYPLLNFAPVLKSNAYGHGLEEVLHIIKNEKIKFVCVDSHFELRTAKKYAPKLKVLVIGFVRPESIFKTNNENASFALVSFDQLKEVAKKLKSIKKFHLKIDTGMHRQGITENELQFAIDLIKSNSNIHLEGVFSHFADLENEKESFKQIHLWNNSLKFVKRYFPKIQWTHLSATGGIKYQDKIDANIVRLGIGFYGVKDVGTENFNLKPALELRTIITGVKDLLPKEGVGYGFSFISKKFMKIATIPLGYFEGIDRRLSNLGKVKINGKFSDIIGKISMNITTIDITENKKATYGSEVVVISHLENDSNSVRNLSKVASVIPYEILVHIPSYLKRIIV